MNSLHKQHYVQQAILGDKRAFNRLADCYYADCLRKAYAIVNDETLAQDLTQVSLLQAYRCLDTLQEPSRFKYWLLGIVRNICRNYLKQKRIQFLSLDALLAEPNEEQIGTASQEIVEAVSASVYALESSYREILTAFYYEGLSLADIAQQQCISLSAAKVRLHRARLLLKEKLTDHRSLFYYHRQSIKIKPMEQLIIADIYQRERGNATLLLQTKNGEYFLSIIVGREEAQAIFLGVQQYGFRLPRPYTHDLAATLLTATGATIDRVCIHALIDGVFYAQLMVKKGKKTIELDARPSDAIALAVRQPAPIYVSDAVLTEAGIPIPEFYRNTPSKGKGLNQFVRLFAHDKAYRIAKEAWKQRSKSVPRKPNPNDYGERILTLAFGDEELPRANAGWQPTRYTTWDEALKVPDQVKWLDLRNQDLTDFEEKSKLLDSVTALVLTGYGLAQVPPGLTRMEKIERLDVSDNQLIDLPTTLPQLTQLNSLNLSKNSFCTLPTTVAQLPALQWLDLSENSLLDFSQTSALLQAAPALHSLKLCSNRLSRLPEELAKLAFLEQLVLSDNPSLDFSQTFEVLSSIPTLHTSGIATSADEIFS